MTPAQLNDSTSHIYFIGRHIAHSFSFQKVSYFENVEFVGDRYAYLILPINPLCCHSFWLVKLSNFFFIVSIDMRANIFPTQLLQKLNKKKICI